MKPRYGRRIWVPCLRSERRRTALSLASELISSATSPSSRAFPECGSVCGASASSCKPLSLKPFPSHPHPKSGGRLSCFATVWSALPGPSSQLESLSGPGMQGVEPSAAETGSGSLGQQLHFRPQPQRQPLLQAPPARDHMKPVPDLPDSRG